MAVTTVRWRPGSETPPVGTVALIAIQDEDGLFLAEDLFVATEAGWVSEADHYHRWPRPFKQTDHWLPEHELLSGLRDGA